MAGNKYLASTNGIPTEVAAVDVSAGAADAGKLMALDSSGKLPVTMLPTGVGADTASIVAFEALAAGDFVNVFSDTGAFKMRKADASGGLAKKAHGFVLSAVAAGASGTMYFEGTNTAVTGLTPGTRFLSSTTPGGSSAAAPAAAAGVLSQIVGVAISATAINFQDDVQLVFA